MTTAAAAAHTHPDPLNVVLLIIAFLVFHTLKCLLSPTKRCPRCKGQRMILRGQRRATPCQRCQVKGRVPRLGAQPIHRFTHDLAGTWIAGRVRRRLPPATTDRNPHV